MQIHRTVLLIADSEDLDPNYGDQLQQEGRFTCQVLPGCDGASTITLCQSQHIDGILLALTCANSDGLSMLQHLTRQMGDRCPPIIVIGGDDARRAVQALKQGATDYLVKDWLTPESLRLAVGSAIANAELKRELQRSQERFQTSVETMLDCFGIFSSIRDEAGQITDFRIDYLNDAACINNHMPKQMQIGRGLCEVLPGHRESGLFDEYCHLVETGEPLIKDSLVYDDTFGDRRLVRAFDIRASKLNDGFVASWRDITDRKQLEMQLSQTAATLQQQQHRLQQLIDTVPIGIGIGTASGVVKVANDTMLALHGYTREAFEQQGLNWRDFVPPEDQEHAEQAMHQLQQQGFLPPAEKNLLLPDGRRVPVWISAMQWIDSTDEHVAFAVDLTLQKQTEAALKASQQRYQDLAEAMPQIVWTADASGAVNYWNHRWYEYTGLRHDQSMGLDGINIVHPDDRDRTLAAWQRAIARGEPFEIEYRLRRGDGVYCWFISRAIPTTDDRGQVTGWIGTITNINDIKHSEALLRQNEQQLQQQLAEIEAIYQTAPIGLNVLDADLRFIRINQRLAEMNGFSVEAHIGRTVRDLLPDLADTAEQLLRPILETGEPLLNVEIHGETPAQPGVKRAWLEHFLPLKDGDRVIGISTVCEEITERAQIEAALRQSEERFRTLADNISQFAWMADAQGWLVWYNQRWFEYTGTTLEQMQGWGWQQVHHPDHVNRVAAKFRRCIETGETWEDTFPLRRHDGQYRWFLSRAIPVRDYQGRVLRWFGTNTDITDLRETELALKQTTERLNLALKSAPLTLFNQDRELRYTWIYNPTHNLSAEEVLGKRDEDLVCAETAAQLTHLKQQVLDTGVGLRQEVQFTTHQGETVHYDLTIDPIRDTMDAVVGVTCAAVDITSLKQAEAQQEQLLQREQTAREAAERANRIKDEFLAVLSHELRSPLNPILGWAKLLQTQKLTPQKTADALAAIERNARLQTQLIDDLLDIAKILRGKLSLDVAPTHLSGIIEAAIETVRPAAVAKAIALQVILAETGPVSGDAGRLQQTLWNLLSNAIKFTPEGGRVEVRLEQVMAHNPSPASHPSPPSSPISHYAQITVSDTGKGINPNFLPYIFESFRQEDLSTTRKYGGLGLGLAIVRQLVEAHGGTITVDSPGEGAGATFTMRLPLLQAEPNPPALEPSPEPERDLMGIRVLTVDDERDACELLTVLLTQYKAEVLSVNSAAEALANLPSFRPQVLISDIGMPEVDGYTFIQQVRALPAEQGGQVPAIALTAYAREEDHQRALASGYQRHITKPLEIEPLLDAVWQLANPNTA